MVWEPWKFFLNLFLRGYPFWFNYCFDPQCSSPVWALASTWNRLHPLLRCTQSHHIPANLVHPSYPRPSLPSLSNHSMFQDLFRCPIFCHPFHILQGKENEFVPLIFFILLLLLRSCEDLLLLSLIFLYSLLPWMSIRLLRSN